MHTSNKTRAFTRPTKWSHIGRRSSNGGIFPIFKRALRTKSNKAQRAYTPDRDLYEHEAEHNQYVADLFGSVQTALDDFDDRVERSQYLETEYYYDAEYDRAISYYYKFPYNTLLVEQHGPEMWRVIRTGELDVAATLRLDRTNWVWRALVWGSEELTIPFEDADEHAMIRLMMTLIRMQ